MKMFKRMLAVWIALALLAAVPVVAEEPVEVAMDAALEAVEAPSPELEIEPEVEPEIEAPEEPAAAPEVEVTAEPEVEAEGELPAEAPDEAPSAAEGEVGAAAPSGEADGESAAPAPGEDPEPGEFAIDESGTLTGYRGGAVAVIPEGVVAIGEGAFRGQVALERVWIPESVESIGREAFAGCENLAEVAFSRGLTRIAERAFLGCARLEEIELPEGLLSIGAEAFAGCVFLGRIALPASAVDVADTAFLGCPVMLEAAPQEEREPAGEAAREETETPAAPEVAERTIPVPISEMVVPEALTLGVKESVTLDVRYIPSAEEDVLTFASSAPKIAKVSAAGKITGVKNGTAVITVTSAAGASATCTVKVQTAPSKVTLSAKKATLGVGQTLALTATLPKNTASQLTWTSGNNAVATVENGVVTAVSAGTAKITVRTFNKKTATCTLTVKPAATAVELAESLKLCVDQEYALAHKLVPASAVSDVTYESSAPSVVSVEGDVLTAKQTGAATITVTARNGEGAVSAQCAVTVVAGPTAVKIENPIATLGVKESWTLSASLDADAELGAYNRWSSSKPKVLKVDARSGKLTGVKTGTAEVTVTAANGASETITVKVQAAPSKVTLNAKKATLGVGQTLALKATLPKNTSSQFTWTSGNNAVAMVEDGVVTAVSAGTAKITVRTFNKKTATCTLTVKPAATEVIVPAQLSLCQDQVYALEAELAPAGALSDVSYESDDPSVVAVEGNVLTAKQIGTATVTVTARNGEGAVSARCEVAVKEGPTAVRISNPVATLGVKESYTLETELEGPQEFASFNTWSSSKPKILKVDARSGKLTGVKTGTATVTVTTVNGKSDAITVKVQAAPSKVTLSAKKATLGVGQTLELKATLPKNTASQLTWTSGNDAVAAVADGVVTAVSEGTAKITVRTFNKKTATCTITVKPKPTGLELTGPGAMWVGQKDALVRTLEPANAACGITYWSDNVNAVTVDGNGKLAAVGVGSATIHAQTHNGLERSCTVAVYAAPTKVSIVNAVKNLGLKETYQLEAETDSDGSLLRYCKWSSSNKKVVTVDASGKLKAVKTGTAKITVTLNGKKATASVTVVSAPGKLTLSQAEATLAGGETLQLTATLPKKTASQITWSSSAPEVATVANGLVTAVGGGRAVITASTFNGHSAECVVTVQAGEPPVIFIDGKAAGEAVVEVNGGVDISWSCAEVVRSYSVLVADESGAAILQRDATGETAARIEKAQMTSGTTYTVTVTATIAAGSAFATAKFRFVDLEHDYTYEITDAGATITRYTGTEEALRVPETLGGAKVVRIATGAFNGENCAKIASVVWPKGVAFEEDSVAGLKKCADANGFLVFDGVLCEYFGKAASVTIPASVTRVNDGAFAGNATVQTVRIPNGVRTIGARAFAGCGKLAAMESY